MSYSFGSVSSYTETLSLGWVAYWNLLPLKTELLRLYGDNCRLERGAPEQVNRWLSDGRVQAAPSSSVCLVRNGRHDIALPLGIASYGAVTSVYFGLHHEELHVLEIIRERQRLLRDIVRQGMLKFGTDARRLAAFIWKSAAMLPPVDADIPPPVLLTPASATSAALSRILYRLWFGQAAAELRSQGATTGPLTLSMRRPMELLIGDEALIRRPQYRAIIDLGEAWRELTDLPFVFAVWQTAGQSLSTTWRQRLFEVAELAQARMSVEPSHYFPDMPVTDVNGHPIDLGHYWKHIHYRLGPAHFKALAIFLSLARLLDPEKIEDDAIVNIMRWEGFAETARNLST